MPHGLNVLLSLLARAASFGVLALLLHEVLRARNGLAMRRLRDVFAALLFGLAWFFLASLDDMVNWVPGLELRPLAFEYSWVPSGTLGVALWRLWRAL